MKTIRESSGGLTEQESPNEPPLRISKVYKMR